MDQAMQPYRPWVMDIKGRDRTVSGQLAFTRFAAGDCRCLLLTI